MQTALSLLALHAIGLAGYAWWVTTRVAAGMPAWPFILAVPLIYALAVLGVTLTDFALAWLWRSPRPLAVRIGAGATVRMIAQEFRALLPSAWRMIRYPFTQRLPAPTSAVLPVVLVHGVLCNGGVWSTVVAACRARAIAPIYRLSYGPPLASIEDFAEQLATLIETACRDTGAARVVVVGHSMGGLVVRAYLRHHGAARLARVITLGTPNRGSRFAKLMLGTSLAQIRPGSAWLAALPARVDAVPPFVALWSWHDSMVAPQASCELPGARNVPLTGVGHNALIHDANVVAKVIAELEDARAIETVSVQGAHDHGQAG